MRLKKLVKDCIPPVILKARNNYNANHQLCDSYDSAMSKCQDGYEESRLIDVVFEKTKIYRDSLLLRDPFAEGLIPSYILAGISFCVNNGELNVIDFGGSCGGHYFALKQILGNSVNIHWHVVETPKLALRAKALEDENLKFFDNLQEAKATFKRIDLVFSSGALQYTPQPYKTLKELVECKAENIFMTNVGLSDLSKDLFIVQKSMLNINGAGKMPKGMQDGIVYYPATFIMKHKFEQILQNGYTSKGVITENPCHYIAGRKPVAGYGYFGQKKAPN